MGGTLRGIPFVANLWGTSLWLSSLWKPGFYAEILFLRVSRACVCACAYAHFGVGEREKIVGRLHAKLGANKGLDLTTLRS